MLSLKTADYLSLHATLRRVHFSVARPHFMALLVSLIGCTAPGRPKCEARYERYPDPN